MKEKELCLALGLSRDLIKELRNSYEEGVCWTRKESKKPKHLWEINWTEQGVSKLRTNLNVKEEENISPPEQKQGTVCHKFHNNTRFIGVLLEGKEERVLCRDSSKFGIGMPVDVKWDVSRWVVARHPRYVGKY